MTDQELRFRARTTTAQMSAANGSPCPVVELLPFRIKRATAELDDLRDEHRQRGMVLADLEMCALWQQLAEELAELEDLIALRESELRSIEACREEVAK
jgi:hypothetical protein